MNMDQYSRAARWLPPRIAHGYTGKMREPLWKRIVEPVVLLGTPAIVMLATFAVARYRGRGARAKLAAIAHAQAQAAAAATTHTRSLVAEGVPQTAAASLAVAAAPLTAAADAAGSNTPPAVDATARGGTAAVAPMR